MKMTEEQREQIRKLATQAILPFLERLDLDRDEAQRLITHGDRLVGMRETLLDAARVRYKNQETAPKLAYPSGWRGFKSVEDQLKILIKEFPRLKPGPTLEQWQKLHPDPAVLPEGAEGWVVLPKSHRIVEDWHSRYIRSMSAVAERLSKHFPDVKTSLKEGLARGSFLIDRRTNSFLCAAEMGYQTMQHDGDFYVIAAQFGMKRADQSALRARETLLYHEDKKDNWVEAALGPYEVAIMLLTHPERFAEENVLGVGCAGATCYKHHIEELPSSPMFHTWSDPRKHKKGQYGVYLGNQWLWSDGSGTSGQATGFIWEKYYPPGMAD